MTERQLLVDIWEGNIGLEPQKLLDNGVKGMIVRINDMGGGHHIDARFAENLAIAKLFSVHGVYFVYNPWVNGISNYNWLIANLPTSYKNRLFIDIEVRYAGYSPVTYAEEVAKFLVLVKKNWLVSPYTGQWFLPTLSSWPRELDYWWAAYPSALSYCPSWAEYRRILDTLDFAYNKASCPGKVVLWQASGDYVKLLEGFGGRAVDVNVFLGTEAELKTWFGQAPTPIDNTKAQLLVLTEQLKVLINKLP